jgi:Flp pilus assembly protein TadB
VRLPQFTIVLLSAIVTIVALGAVGGLDTVEVATMSIIIGAALVVWFVRQPRQARLRE